MDQNIIIKELENAGALLKGHFILSSGLHSDTYIQCARVLMDPARAGRLCSALADKVRQTIDIEAIDYVVAPAMGGVVVGYEMGRQLGKVTMFCERVDGSFALRRGFQLEKGAKVLVVEDVVTTGKSSNEAIACIKECGAEPVAEACLIDRSSGNSSLDIPLVPLISLEVQTFSKDAVPESLADTPAEKPGSRWLKA